MNTKYWIRKAVALIVADLAPEAIYLFGSCIKGAASPQDIDLAVIYNTELSKHLRGIELRERLREFPVRIDAVFLTPGELSGKAHRLGSFTHSVLTTGKLVYRRKGIDKSSHY